MQAQLPIQRLSPAQIIKSYEVDAVYKLRNAVQNLAANTYRAVADWKYKKKTVDIYIEELSKNIKPYTNEEDEFKFVNSQLYLLYTKDNSDEKKLLKLVENLITERRDFTELKNDTKFPLSNKINVFGVSFFLLNLFANKLHITENANYPIFTFIAAASFFTGSMIYRVIWKRCCFQPSLKDKAEKLRIIAKNVYEEFLPNPPKLNQDLQSNECNPQSQYQAIINEREKERELKTAKKQKILKITNGDIVGEV